MVRSPRAHHTNIAALAALKRNKPLDAVRQIRAPGDQALALLELGTSAYLREGPGVLYCVTRAGLIKVGHTVNFDRRSLQYSGCEAPGNMLTWILKIPVPHQMLAGTFHFLPALQNISSTSSSSANSGRPSLLLYAPEPNASPPIGSGTPSMPLAGGLVSDAFSGGPSSAFMFCSALSSLPAFAFETHTHSRYLADITGKLYHVQASLHERRLQHSGIPVIKPVLAALDGQQSALLVYRNETKQRTYFGSRFASKSN
ncbi:hypothetical protein DFH09DRAFT_1118941 [Mycena vulgaris]|nr:hypothetical protein DFH09DRAFT_1118941 [Mycena vulgaris]